jgi:metal-dependent amidase/aminoacylase/carboxypeptidase family protein
MKKDYFQLREWLSETSQDFHMHPEISHQDWRTTDKIVEILKALKCRLFAPDNGLRRLFFFYRGAPQRHHAPGMLQQPKRAERETAFPPLRHRRAGT